MGRPLALLVTLICVWASATDVAAAVITQPTGLAPGAQYRLAFVTTGQLDGTASSVSAYNNYVSTAANAVPALVALSTTWTAIVSTTAIDAYDNTNTRPSSVSGGSLGLPIYLLNDVKLVDSNDDLWDGSLDVAFGRTELNTAAGLPDVWTGTLVGGTVSANPLGSANPTTGLNIVTTSSWTDDIIQGNTSPLALYAISAPLTAVPEPSAVLLLLLVLSSAAAGRRAA